MLSIAKLSAGQERYYLEEAGERVDVVTSVGSGVEDYYLDPVEARGEWVGATRSKLGLDGPVEDEQLRALMAGIGPIGGESLRAATSPVGVAGFDLTFSAPKSVSVLFGAGDARLQEAARTAHDVAVREALKYLERSAAAVRRAKGGVVVEPVEGFVGAAFRHRSSRAGDPQLHTHVVIANVGQGSDGRWTALDGRRIYREATTASYVYQAVLRSQLTIELGVGWTPVIRGIGEIDGVPHDLMRSFSRRRAEIEASMASRGTAGPRAAEAAALATRRAKPTGVDPAGLFEDWRARAQEFDWSPDRLPLSPPMSPSRIDLRALADQLLGPQGLTRTDSSFTRRDVIRAVCAELAPSADLDLSKVEAVADFVLGDERIVTLHQDRGREVFRRRDGSLMPTDPEQRRYSTVEMLGLERRIVDAAEAGADAHAGVVDDAHLTAATSRRPSLSAEQRTAVEALTTGGKAVAVIAGRAGTGKTFALGAAREAWEASGHQVLGVAVARRAARELELEAGIPSTSVAAMLDRLERTPLPPQSVLVVDEAGMLGTRDLACLLEHVNRAAGKLVLVGDQAQLPALSAGGAFGALIDRGHAVELRENRRQVERWERVAVDHLRDGRAFEALAMYEAHDRIHVGPDQDSTREELVDQWWAANDRDSVMIASRRADVADLNARARERMRLAGRLGPDVEIFDQSFAVGDQVVLKRNDARLGAVNGDRGVVVAIEPRRGEISVDTAAGRVTLDAAYMFSGREKSVLHGYAMTCHVAQGATVDRAFVLADLGMFRELGYTALTRGREENHLFLTEQRALEREEYAPRGAMTRSEPLVELAIALERSEAEPLALDRGIRSPQRGIGR